MNDKATCEICNKNPGAFSRARDMHICEPCWFALGAREKAYDNTHAFDLTGQDEEVA
jgi:hypothetical protein